jgi:hypothetical protein
MSHTKALSYLLLAATLVAGVAVPPAGASHRTSAPLVTVSLGHRGATIHGPTRWHAGTVRISVATTVPDQELSLVRFRPGYSYTRFLADGALANSHGPAAIAAIRRVFAGTEFLGGADVFPGVPASFSVTVRPGTYYLGEMSARPVFREITVGRGAGAVEPAVAARLTAADSYFRTNRPTLPAHGTLTIRNTGRQVHRLNFVPVKTGTTCAQLGAWLRKTGGRPDGPPPPFAGRGPQLGTAMISPGRQFEFAYTLPAGQYAVVSFQPDSHTGKPQTLDGLYTIVTLR